MKKIRCQKLAKQMHSESKISSYFQIPTVAEAQGEKRLLNSHHLGDYSIAANVINVSPFHSNVNLIVVGLIVSLYREASLLQYCQLTATPQSQLCCQT